MTEEQENIMTNYFEKAFKYKKNLSYSQVAYILNITSWAIEPEEKEFKENLDKFEKRDKE